MKLCIENGNRHSELRNLAGLDAAFVQFPDAGFCFSFANAYDYDTTMIEATLMLRKYADRLCLIRLGAMSCSGYPEMIHLTVFNSYRKVVKLIPRDVPVVLEYPVGLETMGKYVNIAEKLFRCESAPE